MTFGTRVRRGWWTDSCFNNCQSWVTFGSLLFPHSKQQLKSKRNTHKSEWSSLSYDLKVEGHDHCSLKAVFIMLTFKSFLLLLFFCHVMSATWLASHHFFIITSCLVVSYKCLCVWQSRGGTRSVSWPWGTPAVTTLGSLQLRAPTQWDALTSWWTTL